MRYPDRIAVATKQHWMDGTTITLDDSGRVAAFHLGNTGQDVLGAQKTVNLYSLSWPLWERVMEGAHSRFPGAVCRQRWDCAAGGG